MNVLGAVNKLDDIRTKIDALVRVIMKLESDKGFSQELEILNEYKNALNREKSQLEQRLMNTQLANLR